jgi:hypothetical protein
MKLKEYISVESGGLFSKCDEIYRMEGSDSLFLRREGVLIGLFNINEYRLKYSLTLNSGMKCYDLVKKKGRRRKSRY